MTEAVFGVVGVVLGAILGAGASYFMVRRKSWSDARDAALLLLEELHVAQRALERGTYEPGGLGVAAWQNNRRALTFRKGCYPSGLHALEWLDLAAAFDNLRLLDRCSSSERDETWLVTAHDNIEHARRLVHPFELDPPVLSTFVLCLGHSIISFFSSKAPPSAPIEPKYYRRAR